MAQYGVKELVESFQTVRKNTITIAEDIPEDKYGFRSAPEVMSVREMLAHLAVSTQWQISVHGARAASIDFSTFGEHLAKAKAAEQALVSKADILKALKDNGDAFAGFLGGLSNETLDERVSFPHPVGSSKSRLEMLLSTKEHEMHHRGQLMLIERQIGIVPHLTKQRQAFAAAAQTAAR